MADLNSYRFTKTHEWLRPEDSGEAVVGISDFAQAQLGDVIFLELPAAGTKLTAGSRLGAVESVKAASDIYCPAGGEVMEVNEAVNGSPELVNQDPYGSGWLVRLRLLAEPPPELMDAAAYDEYAASQQH